MKWKTNSVPFRHNNQSLKIVLSLLLACLAFKLLFFPSPTWIHSVGIATERDSIRSVNVYPGRDGHDEVSIKEKCDLFSGDWILNPFGPFYTNASCSYMDPHLNCMKNGRPDTGYMYWRWKPKRCELPPFDPKIFLLLMRNKSWAMIGDSICRNHAQSLVCMLATVEAPQQVYDRFKSPRWIFCSYNFTLSVIWSPYLGKATIFNKFDGVPTTEWVHLDKLDKAWTSLYPHFDYMIISVGRWFSKSTIYYENDKVVGCHLCDREGITEVGVDFPYRRIIHDVLDFIVTSKHRGIIFFRTSPPDHFEGGEWNEGGTCEKAIPVKDGELKLDGWLRILHDIDLFEFDATLEKATKNGVDLRLLDFTKLMLTRPDGHPGSYRNSYPFAKDKNAKVRNDCTHWCLPGPIDYWNDMILEMLVNPNQMMGTTR